MNIRLTAKTMLHIEGDIWSLIAYYQIKPEGSPNSEYKTTSDYKSYGLFEEIEEAEYKESNHHRSNEYFSFGQFVKGEEINRRYYKKVKTEEEK